MLSFQAMDGTVEFKSFTANLRSVCSLKGVSLSKRWSLRRLPVMLFLD